MKIGDEPVDGAERVRWPDEQARVAGRGVECPVAGAMLSMVRAVVVPAAQSISPAARTAFSAAAASVVTVKGSSCMTCRAGSSAQPA